MRDLCDGVVPVGKLHFFAAQRMTPVLVKSILPMFLANEGRGLAPRFAAQTDASFFLKPLKLAQFLKAG